MVSQTLNPGELQTPGARPNREETLMDKSKSSADRAPTKPKPCRTCAGYGLLYWGECKPVVCSTCEGTGTRGEK